MSVFEWSEDYAVDNGMIDEQHKYLLQISEKLFDAVIEQSEEKVLQDCFDNLLSYTQKHFEDEEDFFQSADKDILSNHISEHKTLSEELLQVWSDEKSGNVDEPGRVLLNWVEERLIPHMMFDDQQTYNAINLNNE